MVLDAQQHTQYNPPLFYNVGTSFSKYQGFQNTSLRIQIQRWLSNYTSLLSQNIKVLQNTSLNIQFDSLVLIFISNINCFKISPSGFNSTAIV